MQALLRFLEYVRRELGADDVRGELGGRDPEQDVVWATMPGGIRVVAIFDTPPEDLAAMRVKLRTLVESFASLGGRDHVLGGEGSQPPAQRVGVGHDLDDALDVLAQRARALAALVIDDASPVIWGSSLVPHGPEDLDEAIWVARVAGALEALGLDPIELVAEQPGDVHAALAAKGAPDAGALARDVDRLRDLGTRVLDRPHVLAMRALAAVRESEGKEPPPRPAGTHLMVREFASIYRLVLVFDGGFSELHAEAALIHALPAIERLVTSLPPRDPVSGGAKVAVLRRLRRV
jgi:hypothetical protein